MPERVASERSETPVTTPPSEANQPERRSVHVSVTVHAPSAGSIAYDQVETGRPNELTSKTNARGSSQRVTFAVVLHRRHPLALRPRKRAPTAGPVADPSHLPPWF